MYAARSSGNFCALHFLGSTSTISRFLSTFVMVETVWSVSFLPFFYSRCPRAQPSVKEGGGMCPRALWSRRDTVYV